MRIIVVATLSLLLFASACAGAADSSAALSKVNFVREIPIVGAQKLLGWSDDIFYYAKQDGSVQVVDKDGRPTLVLQAKDRKNNPVLERPEAVAVADGTVYVVDSLAHRVAMFALDGKYKGSFGVKGSGVSELRAPRGIAIYEGVIYVADSGNKRVQLFGSNGVFLTALEIDTAPENNIAKEKELPYKLGQPIDIGIDVTGTIYVLDADDSLIKIYNQKGAFLKTLPQNGKPVALSIAQDGIYVADQESYSIQKYDFSGKQSNYFGSKGEGRAQFKSINGLAVDKGQQVFVGDGKRAVMQVFLTEAGGILDPAFKQATRPFVRWQEDIPATVDKMVWNGKDTIYGIDKDKKAVIRIRNGVAEGEIKVKDLVPVAVAVDKSGALWVLDKKMARAVKLDDAGNILASFGTEGNKPGQLDAPTDIAISSTGNIFIADRGNHCVQAFNSEGVFVKMIHSTVTDKLDNPTALAFDPQDNLYVLDKGRSIIASFSAKGDPVAEFGKTNSDDPGNLVNPTGLLATLDEVFVLDADRVRVYSLKGKYIRSFGAEGKGFGEFDDPASIATKDGTSFLVSDPGNKRVQALVTVYKPVITEKMTARGGIHFIELQWAPSASPYVEQYRIYRSKKENGGYVRIGVSNTNKYLDEGLGAEERYYYRVTAETQLGYEGPMGPKITEVSRKYTPPPLEGVQIEPSTWQVKMKWKPLEHPYFSSYVIYQKKDKTDELVKVGETTTPEFVKDGLLPETAYTFYVSNRSKDGVESERFEVNATTLVSNKQPLEIEVIQLHNIFSNTYKLYEEEGGVGRIKFTNNTGSVMQNLKVSFVLKNFMDYPTESRIDTLLPGQSTEVTLRAVFNNAILTLTEDTSVQAQLEASYFENGQPKVFSKVSSITVYEKHRMTWDEDGRYAAFITPKDTPMINLSRAVATQFKEVSDDAQRAAAVFNMLGALGLNYMQDPSNPFQSTSTKTTVADYIQYPRETIERKAGDCDDLVALYSSVLESFSIPTLVLEVPGHMFMMFSTGIHADDDRYTMDDMYVIHDGKLWIPVETTMVGKPFVKAWEQGAETYYKGKNKGELTILDVHKAWGTYKPASLPESTWKPAEVSKEQIEKRFPGDFTSMLKISSQTKTRRYLQLIKKNPVDMDAHLQVGIILARAGDRAGAKEYLDKVISVQPSNAAALNNRGNLSMMEGRYLEAQKAYSAASLADPKDPEILVNLTKAYQAIKDTKKAKAAFTKAQDLDPTVKKKYKAMALELLNGL